MDYLMTAVSFLPGGSVVSSGYYLDKAVKHYKEESKSLKEKEKDLQRSKKITRIMNRDLKNKKLRPEQAKALQQTVNRCEQKKEERKKEYEFMSANFTWDLVKKGGDAIPISGVSVVTTTVSAVGKIYTKVKTGTRLSNQERLAVGAVPAAAYTAYSYPELLEQGWALVEGTGELIMQTVLPSFVTD